MKRIATACIAAIVLAISAASMAAIPAQIHYQGVLTDAAGTPVFDATYTVAFRLYTAPTGGTPIWSETESVTTSGGVFTKVLGNTSPLSGLAFDQPYWLGISVGGGAELPRQALLAGPYAMRAGTADNVAMPIQGTANTTGAVIDASNPSNTGTSVRGTNTATSGTGAAVEGISSSQAGNAMAVRGEMSSTTPGSFSAAVRGENLGTGANGIGVWGSQAGTGWGVYGTSNGAAVFGMAGGTSASATGVMGRTTSPNGTGVEAIGPSSGTGNALTITQGALRVRGAGQNTPTTAFIHVVTASNLDASQTITTITHPLLDGHPDRIVFVTGVNPPAGSTALAVGDLRVAYDTAASKWTIEAEEFGVTSGLIGVGAQFNVLIVAP